MLFCETNVVLVFTSFHFKFTPVIIYIFLHFILSIHHFFVPPSFETTYFLEYFLFTKIPCIVILVLNRSHSSISFKKMVSIVARNVMILYIHIPAFLSFYFLPSTFFISYKTDEVISFKKILLNIRTSTPTLLIVVILCHLQYVHIQIIYTYLFPRTNLLSNLPLCF